MKNYLSRLLQKIGPLRILLFLLTLVLVLFSPEPGVQSAREGAAVITTLIFPTIVPMIFMGLLLDALMSRVRQVDLEGEEKKRYKMLTYLNLGFALLLLLAWLPFLLALGRQGG